METAQQWLHKLGFSVKEKKKECMSTDMFAKMLSSIEINS